MIEVNGLISDFAGWLSDAVYVFTYNSPQLNIKSVRLGHYLAVLSVFAALKRGSTESTRCFQADIVMCPPGYVPPKRENTSVSKRWTVRPLLCHFSNAADNIRPGSKPRDEGMCVRRRGLDFKVFGGNDISFKRYSFWCFASNGSFFLSFHLSSFSRQNTPSLPLPP